MGLNHNNKVSENEIGVESYKLLSLGNPRLHVLNARSQHFKSSEKKFLYFSFFLY